MKTYKLLSGSVLKLTAVCCMLVDHLTRMGAHVWPWMGDALFTVEHTAVTPAFIGTAVIGRMAFPLFAFLCVEGFRHTSDLKKYMLTMLVFAVLSIVPFNLMKGNVWYYWRNLNVLFTLLLGLCGMYCIRNLKPVPAAAGVIAALAVAFLFRCDYSAYGVAMIIVMYLLEKPAYQGLAVLAVLGRSKYTICGALAAIPMVMYNGSRGFIRGRAWKYAFYAFYPLHMLLLWWLFR